MELESPQLASAKRLLRNAHSLVEDVAAMFHRSGDAEMTGRLKSLTGYIADEILELDHKIAITERSEKSRS
jgi:hypothetical protein